MHYHYEKCFDGIVGASKQAEEEEESRNRGQSAVVSCVTHFSPRERSDKS